jgi:hypothetical protein
MHPVHKKLFKTVDSPAPEVVKHEFGEVLQHFTCGQRVHKISLSCTMTIKIILLYSILHAVAAGSEFQTYKPLDRTQRFSG